MNSLELLQVSDNVLLKSAEMAEKDPHGSIITLVSIGVVFMALIILYIAYSMIGKIISGHINIPSIIRKAKTSTILAKRPKQADEVAVAIAMALDKELNGETYAAISLAMHQYLNDTVHDIESYVITIRRK